MTSANSLGQLAPEYRALIIDSCDHVSISRAWWVIRGVALRNRPLAESLIMAATPYAYDDKNRLVLLAQSDVISAWVSTGLIELVRRAARQCLIGCSGVCFIKPSEVKLVLP